MGPSVVLRRDFDGDAYAGLVIDPNIELNNGTLIGFKAYIDTIYKPDATFQFMVFRKLSSEKYVLEYKTKVIDHIDQYVQSQIYIPLDRKIRITSTVVVGFMYWDQNPITFDYLPVYRGSKLMYCRQYSNHDEIASFTIGSVHYIYQRKQRKYSFQAVVQHGGSSVQGI